MKQKTLCSSVVSKSKFLPRRVQLLALGLIVFSIAVEAQTPTAAPSVTPPEIPTLVKMKKTVVFLTVKYQDGADTKEIEGTAFLVGVPDSRLGKGGEFIYLVTNRHMADPSVGAEHPVQALSISVRSNRVATEGDTSSRLLDVPGAIPKWVFPSDPSVDLAVCPFGFNPEAVDALVIPESLFATKDVVNSRQISEGDTVLFTGFFAQFPGKQKIQPIIREGKLAMLPDEDIPTTLGVAGHLYLADMHVFHGNSGSPVFVNIGGFRQNMMTPTESFLLLGVVSGFVYETSDLQLQVTSTVSGKLGSNSGIATIVPVDELKALLDGPELTVMRRNATVNSTVPLIK